jgi:tRNA nucleotidyltransferase (CCA-adding enzyme)
MPAPDGGAPAPDGGALDPTEPAAEPEPAPVAGPTPGRHDPIPAGVRAIAGTLRKSGHEAHLVGGCVRDLLRGVEPADWDVATDARPERLLALFPDALYENRFGTVAIQVGDETYEVTTYRHDGPYSDHRRPDAVVFGEHLDDDLARRDFTVNAMALAIREEIGADADAEPPADGARPLNRAGVTDPAAIHDPFGGRADLAAGILRAVGDPATRFREDSLRMLRAVRFAATLGFAVEPQTLAAIEADASLARSLSGERVLAELLTLLAAPVPSVGLRLAQETGLLAAIAPELARQRGVPQGKVPGEDLWDHTCRTVDATPRPAPDEPPLLRLAALLHDVGKPATFADGHFVGHDAVGASLTEAWLTGLHAPRFLTADTANLVRHHMFAYDASWTDAAVRRFIRRCGASAIQDLLALRAADNVGSGLAPDVDGLESLRARCREQLDARVALDLAGLAINGDDLMKAFEVPAGPALGKLLDRLLELVVVDPMLNDRSRLLTLAHELVAADAATSGPAGASTVAPNAPGPRADAGSTAGTEPT